MKCGWEERKHHATTAKDATEETEQDNPQIAQKHADIQKIESAKICAICGLLLFSFSLRPLRPLRDAFSLPIRISSALICGLMLQ
jgi:hypothetical protein